MTILRLVLADQLSETLASLQGINQSKDIIMLCEVMDEATYVKHHKKKIAFLFGAMRHFSDECRSKGYTVHYVKLDDPDNTGNFTNEIKRAVQKFRPNHLLLTEPGE